MTYHWLLFDADGTLFNYDQAEPKAFESTFRDLNLAYLPHYADTYQQINQQIWLDFENGLISAPALRVRRFELLFAAVQMTASALDGGAGTAPLAERFSTRYLYNLSQGSDLYPGADELIHALHGKYRMAIITNGLKDVQRSRLALSSIGRLFDEIGISEELGAAKPDVRFFEAFFERIGQPPRENVLVIGDSLTADIQGGINYGLDTCWINRAGKPANPKIPATYEIRQLSELLNLL